MNEMQKKHHEEQMQLAHVRELRSTVRDKSDQERHLAALIAFMEADDELRDFEDVWGDLSLIERLELHDVVEMHRTALDEWHPQ